MATMTRAQYDEAVAVRRKYAELLDAMYDARTRAEKARLRVEREYLKSPSLKRQRAIARMVATWDKAREALESAWKQAWDYAVANGMNPPNPPREM